MGRVGKKIKMKALRRILMLSHVNLLQLPSKVNDAVSFDNCSENNALPPLYKYLNVTGARLTLSNQTFRHAKPSEFNDLEDLTIQGVFEDDLEDILEDIWTSLLEIVSKNLDKEPTCCSPMKEQVQELQMLFRQKSDLVNILQQSDHRQDIDQYRVMVTRHVEEINAFMQGYRVLCVTSNLYSEYMWRDYAENHKGIVIRIKPSREQDSKFQFFKPVSYEEHRPALYQNARSFIEISLFCEQIKVKQDMLNKIIYSKTLRWQEESEYRLAIRLGEEEEPWDTLKYNPEEIVEMHLGCNIEPKIKEELANLAISVNSDILIFEVRCNSKGRLSSKKVHISEPLMT